MPALQIIGMPQSTYVRTSRLTAHEKGVDYDLVVEMPYSDAVSAIHPFGRVPVMRHGDVELFESKAINTYIDRAFDGPALIPADPAGQARMEQWVSVINTVIDPLLIRRYLDSHRPEDAVYGEEFGSKGGGPRQWVVDPVDGTKNYIRQVPVWATLIALLDEGRPVVGVVSAPALGTRWFAAVGNGAWKGTSLRKAVPIGVSTVTDIEHASLSYSSLSGWEERGSFDEFLALTKSVWRTRAYGDFLSYMMVAEGMVDIACEPELELYDMAALVPVVEEAGGHFSSLDGVPGPFGGNALATNGALHLPALDALNGR